MITLHTSWIRIPCFGDHCLRDLRTLKFENHCVPPNPLAEFDLIQVNKFCSINSVRNCCSIKQLASKLVQDVIGGVGICCPVFGCRRTEHYSSSEYFPCIYCDSTCQTSTQYPFSRERICT
ncbi:hypothetical protein CEXT_633731 [Caerostris extrusa]|uniref:Uncharacterized protein n=1 Tax=Caerostris extrusa TaxID=172846 RepID=A0AAV4UNP5_CAEEX|nr:hypothetical protein CEXT_633731 [Caerostris extrusa]